MTETPNANLMQSVKIDWPNGISRDIITLGKFKLRSYLVKPSVLVNSGSSYKVTSHCTLTLYYATQEMKNFQELSFKINMRNRMHVIRFFKSAYSWFTSDEFSNLFFYDTETHQLMLDMEQRNLKLMVGGDRKYDQAVMELVPAIYHRDGEVREGCMLTINNTAYSDILRDIDLESLLGILESFSFQAEALLLIQILSRPELWIDRTKNYDAPGYARQPKVVW